MREVELLLGVRGGVVISDTNPHTGRFVSLQIMSDTVVGAMVWSDGARMEGDWTDLGTILAGTIIGGLFSSITLSSGKAIAYSL